MLSVVVPVYNGEKYIEQTIESILASTYEELEIVVVDDGSTDGSPAILERLAAKDKRVNVYRKENGGVVEARNYGVEKASGMYLAFCDQDDLVKPHFYEAVIARMEQDGSDVGICSSARLIDGEESPYDVLAEGVYEERKILSNVLYPMLFTGYRALVTSSGGNHYPNIWVCVFHRSFWNANGIRFRAYVNFEDDLLVKTESLCKANRVSAVAEIGYVWRVDLHSQTYGASVVENLAAKQDAVLADLVRSLQAARATKKEAAMVQRVMRCKQYLDALHYLANSEEHLSEAEIEAFCQENIYNRNFERSIKLCRFIQKGRVKPKVILPLLKHHRTMAAYRAEKVLDKALQMSLKSAKLSGIERRIKR